MSDIESVERGNRKKKEPKARAKRAGLVGPLFSWELVRLARRGQDSLSRFILAMSLFFVLTAFSLVWFRHTTNPYDLFFGDTLTLSLNESSDFGEAFTLTFLIAQLAVLCLLTPAYAAGGIAEEKERKTFIYLLASELTAREIIFGKFLGRVTFLLGIMLAGLPILALCQLHGGADIRFLLLSYLTTACTVIFLAAVGAASAASAETYRGAIFRAYGLTALIVLTGCGVYPLFSPIAVIPELFSLLKAGNESMMWGWGLLYPLAELIAAGAAVYVAVNSVRKLRARLTSLVLRPPRRVLERYRREDRERERYESEMQQYEAMLVASKARREAAHAGGGAAEPDGDSDVPLELVADEPGTTLDRPQVAVRAIPMAPLSAVQPITITKPTLKIRIQPSPRRQHRDTKSTLPRISDNDPFYWKERFTSGTVRTEDDEAMKVMMYMVGGVLSLFIALGLFFTVLAYMNNKQFDAVALRNVLLIVGGGAVFVHLLQIGIAACGSICRERQRLTLESLLTIPVDRSEILWPKWRISLTRGWWWGGPAAVMLTLAFLVLEMPGLFVAAVIYCAIMAPLATSYGIWLSIRCRTVNKALLWYLPLAAVMLLVPIALSSWLKPKDWLMGMSLLLVLASFMGVAAFGFWRLAQRAFDRESVLGPGKG